jgi:hypothetical protein
LQEAAFLQAAAAYELVLTVPRDVIGRMIRVETGDPAVGVAGVPRNLVSL